MKIKEFMKKYLIGFILGVVSACTVSVIAATYFPSNDVTYDNKESGLKSTNVQGAIDELYVECTTVPTGEQIIEDNNLEKDPYECRYFFTGANPNNYVTFNNETAGWRIISVECDGTIKIMRILTGENRAWNTGSNNNWNQSELNTYVNNTYYNGLNSIAKNQIVSHTWGIGSVTYENNNIADQINDENVAKWQGKIALPTVSEYLRTNSNTNCKTFITYNNNYNTCKNTTWMFNNSNWWTMSAFDGNTLDVYYISANGNFPLLGNTAYLYAGERPTLYLSSDIKITGGNGSQSDPYQISM